jgi:hypothetical protein
MIKTEVIAAEPRLPVFSPLPALRSGDPYWVKTTQTKPTAKHSARTVETSGMREGRTYRPIPSPHARPHDQRRLAPDRRHCAPDPRTLLITHRDTCGLVEPEPVAESMLYKLTRSA